MLRLALSILLATVPATAHMQLVAPPPLRSTQNPNFDWSNFDYSMTSPLKFDGTDYPCKGYINNPSSGMKSVDTWAAGSTQSITVQGTATHLGGSCQLVMSYDNGATWNVILSIIGGCLVDSLQYQFTVPSTAPAGTAIFGWNWFNRVGNREMYQNCAVVTITGSGSGLSPTDYPAPFVANVGVNSCSTTEGVDVVFPNPGANVMYGGSYKGSQPASGLGIVGTNCGGAAGNPTGGNTNTNTVSPTTTSSSATTTPSPTIPVNNHNADPTGACQRRKRSMKRDFREMERRHERLIRRIHDLESELERRDTGRVAALQAEHIVHS